MRDPDFDSEDDQAGAEALDETNLTEDGRDIANFDTFNDVYDVTRADGDADDEDARVMDEDEFDPGSIDADRIGDGELGEPLGDYETDIGAAGTRDQGGGQEDDLAPGSIEGLDQVADADTVESSDDATPDFESGDLSDADVRDLGYGKRSADAGAKAEARLDEGLEETFPASDPVSVMPGSD